MIFSQNLVLGTNTEVDVIISKLFLYKTLSFGLFPFKLLSFLNKLSYRYQIGKYFEVVFSGQLEMKCLFDVSDPFVNCESTLDQNFC